jgi:hypothetical protein
MTALTLPGLDAGIWQVRRSTDAAACALTDRHYSRRPTSIGSGKVGGPNRKLVLVTPCERATWVTTWPKYPQDRLDSWRCSVFRNEGAGLSSDLILAAMELTAALWALPIPTPPRDGWSTYVDAAKVASTNPGYCFLVAGWWRDRTYQPDRRRRTLIRLRAAA